MQFTYEEIAYDTQDMTAFRFDDVTLFLSKDGLRAFIARLDADRNMTLRHAERHELQQFAQRSDDSFLRAAANGPEPEGAD